jgi:GrpB-like predicted nucleotidyltransferase (UPF0157 family)
LKTVYQKLTFNILVHLQYLVCYLRGDLDIYVGVYAEEFDQSVSILLGQGYTIKKNTFRSKELCMFEFLEQEIDVGIQLVDIKSRHINFLNFRDYLIKFEKFRDHYNHLKIISEGLSPLEYRNKKSKFINHILSLNILK